MRLVLSAKESDLTSEAIAVSELDEIRAILRDVAANQQQMQTQRNIDELRQILRESISDLAATVERVQMNLDEFSAELRSIFASDSASRAAERLAETRVRNEFRSAMLGLQTETRSILRELAELRQQRQNGSSQE